MHCFFEFDYNTFNYLREEKEEEEEKGWEGLTHDSLELTEWIHHLIFEEICGVCATDLGFCTPKSPNSLPIKKTKCKLLKLSTHLALSHSYFVLLSLQKMTDI